MELPEALIWTTMAFLAKSGYNVDDGDFQGESNPFGYQKAYPCFYNPRGSPQTV